MRLGSRSRTLAVALVVVGLALSPYLVAADGVPVEPIPTPPRSPDLYPAEVGLAIVGAGLVLVEATTF